MTGAAPSAIEVRGLTFRYGRGRAVLDDVSLTVPAGQRALLVGRNGAGKTTLLGVLAGRHLVPPERARVLGRPAFHDTSLAARVQLLGGRFPFDVDVRVAEILARAPGLVEERRERLVALLGVDPEWRMHAISDGQRRRVQLLLGLVRPSDLLLLDEVTTDLDVVARADLLRFLRTDSEARGTTVLYATHIMDGLEDWATHLVLMDEGRIRLHMATGDIPEVSALRAAGVASPLLRVVERWLRDLA